MTLDIFWYSNTHGNNSQALHFDVVKCRWHIVIWQYSNMVIWWCSWMNPPINGKTYIWVNVNISIPFLTHVYCSIPLTFNMLSMVTTNWGHLNIPPVLKAICLLMGMSQTGQVILVTPDWGNSFFIPVGHLNKTGV